MRAAALLLLAGCKQIFGLDPPAIAGASDGSIDVSYDAPTWWNPAWKYRMPLTIVNNSSDALPAGYQVGLARDVAAAPCTGNRDDFRIVYGATEQARVIDEVGPPQWTWFPLAAALAAGATSANEYYVYCGNASPPPAPNDPKVVFDFYDDFTTLDTNTWTVMNTVVVTGGLLVCGGGGSNDNGVVTKNEPFTAKHAVDFVAQASSATNSNWWGGFENGTMDVPPWLLWYTHNPNVVAPTFRGVSADNPWYGNDLPLDTAPHMFSVEHYGDEAMYRLADVPYQTHVYAPMGLPPAMLDVRLWNISNSDPVSYDWVRVRQAVNPPPAATVGAPETY